MLVKKLRMPHYFQMNQTLLVSCWQGIFMPESGISDYKHHFFMKVTHLYVQKHKKWEHKWWRSCERRYCGWSRRNGVRRTIRMGENQFCQYHHVAHCCQQDWSKKHITPWISNWYPRSFFSWANISYLRSMKTILTIVERRDSTTISLKWHSSPYL